MAPDLPEGVDMLRALAELGVRRPHAELVALFCVLFAEATSQEHPAHAYFLERYLRAPHRYDRVRARRRPRSAARGRRPPSGARACVALMDGLQVQWLLDPHSLHVGAGVRRFAQSLVTEPL